MFISLNIIVGLPHVCMLVLGKIFLSVECHKNLFFCLQLIVDIDGIREKCRGEQKQMDKVVIVSQWTSFLNIIKSHLHSNGYRTCEINGM